MIFWKDREGILQVEIFIILLEEILAMLLILLPLEASRHLLVPIIDPVLYYILTYPSFLMIFPILLQPQRPSWDSQPFDVFDDFNIFSGRPSAYIRIAGKSHFYYFLHHRIPFPNCGLNSHLYNGRKPYYIIPLFEYKPCPPHIDQEKRRIDHMPWDIRRLWKLHYFWQTSKPGRK